LEVVEAQLHAHALYPKLRSVQILNTMACGVLLLSLAEILEVH
jgi:hypothetical protein